MGWKILDWIASDRRRMIVAAIVANAVFWPAAIWLNVQFIRWAAG
jgi:hypothetical protein